MAYSNVPAIISRIFFFIQNISFIIMTFYIEFFVFDHFIGETCGATVVPCYNCIQPLDSNRPY